MNSDFLNTLRADGLVSDRNANLTPLTGGVSSDIYLVTDGGRRFVVKRALQKLKVKANWQADVTRNKAEKDYLAWVAASHPEAVPAVMAAGDGYIAMEFLGEGFRNWKQELLQGRFEVRWAEKAGAFLGDIHRLSAADPALAGRFDRMDLFWQLRIDPFLVATGSRHPALQPLIDAEAQRLRSHRSALVHGDFSPKNLLGNDDRLVVLDCETACYADPAFDVAFLLTHLFLKALYHRKHNREIDALIHAFRHAYGAIDEALDLRISRLLLMLLLARVDGKSPVEYLDDEASRNYVRTYVGKNLSAQSFHFDTLLRDWFAGIEKGVR